jgi:arylsulfatase A-like enzyme/Flp pilus assembly protein TadD
MARFPLIPIALLASLFGACSRETPVAPSPSRLNLVLITIDTLRADRVGRGLTPTLDALAKSGARFDDVRSVVPLTLPSHVTIMTGQLPTAHGVRENGVVYTPQQPAPTLARRFKTAGYRTGAFVGAYVLNKRFGLGDGFDTYDDRVKRDVDLGARLEAERPASEVIDAALPWLAETKGPFFLWVHLYDPHAPYEPPAEYLAKANGNAYDGEVAYADAQVERLIDALRSRGLLESTIVAVAGDHGEGLGEHGELTHGMLAYDSTLRVPLVIGGASTAKPQSPHTLAALAPLLLKLSNVAATPNTATQSAADIYAETRYPRAAGWHPLSVLADDRWKLIRSSEAELYDLSSDPKEQSNVASSHDAIVQAMTAKLAAIESSVSAPAASAPSDAGERLRALGYVSGSTAAKVDVSKAPNPARVIDAWTTFETGLSLVNAGRSREALPALKTLAERFAGAPVFEMTYGRALKDSGQAAQAVTVYRRAATKIQDAALYHDLAVAARAAGNNAEAVRAEQAALALEPGNPAAMNGLGLLQIEAGQAKEAAASFERATTLDPSDVSFWTNLGNARRELSDLSGAEAAYKRALENDPNYADAANGIGTLLVQNGKPADAVPWLERAVAHAPDFFEARLNLGIALQESGQRERAATVYSDILARAPARFARERRAAADLLKQVRAR